MILWVAWLALKHRGVSLVTAVNPAIPTGGFVGESKAQILAMLQAVDAPLPADLTLDADATPSERLALVDAFLDRHSDGIRRTISPAAMKRLETCPWKGNARELENLVEREPGIAERLAARLSGIRADGYVVTDDELPQHTPEELEQMRKLGYIE